MSAYLPKYEVLFYISTYMVVLWFGVYQVYLIGDSISENNAYVGFTNGWNILQMKRDDLDHEWEMWKSFSLKHIIWFIGHVLLSEFVRIVSPNKVPCVHAVLGIAFIYRQFHSVVLVFFALKIFTFYVASKFGRIPIWTVATSWVLAMNYMKGEHVQDYINFYFDISESMYFEIVIISAWNILKLLSFTLDCVQQRGRIDLRIHENPFNALHLLAYVLYFPTILVGPIIIYRRYLSMIAKNNEVHQDGDNLRRSKALLLNLLRIGLWLAFNDFALHFIYVNNIMYNPGVLRTVNPWALYAFGYIMGQFFYNKYLVSYGFGLTLATFDRIPTPDLPKCIGRIHLYSDMWKYFDQGLYEFLFIYIYKNICSNTSSVIRKIFGSFVTFAFIYLWHGVLIDFVFIWAIMNFFCVQAEKLGKIIAKSEAYHKMVGNWSEHNRNRLTAFAGSQLYIPASMSNFFFIGGYDVGIIYVERTYFTEGFISYVVLSFFTFCIYNSGEFIWRMERARQAKQLI